MPLRASFFCVCDNCGAEASNPLGSKASAAMVARAINWEVSPDYRTIRCEDCFNAIYDPDPAEGGEK